MRGSPMALRTGSSMFHFYNARVISNTWMTYFEDMGAVAESILMLSDAFSPFFHSFVGLYHLARAEQD